MPATNTNSFGKHNIHFATTKDTMVAMTLVPLPNRKYALVWQYGQ